MTWLKLLLKAYIILLFHCSIAWCSDIHFTNIILLFYCSIAWCSDTHVTNMILHFVVVYHGVLIPLWLIWFCKQNQAILQKRTNHISHMGIRTPSYTTIKEQNYISHIGIRTTCYTTIKEQNHISHKGIRTPWYTTTKSKIILVTWVSEHHEMCTFIVV
jgi:hypothetical protein